MWISSYKVIKCQILIDYLANLFFKFPAYIFPKHLARFPVIYLSHDVVTSSLKRKDAILVDFNIS